MIIISIYGQDSSKIDSVMVPVSAVDNINELRRDLEETFQDPNFSSAFWGVSIHSLQNGETLFNLNPDKLFTVGSVVKLYTTSTALLLLGPEYSYTTEFYTDGKIEDGILKGDLIIRGYGDPSIYYKKGNEQDRLNYWITKLKELEIEAIKGDIIGDDKLFEENTFYPGWLTDYQDNWFAPPTGSFSLNENSIEIVITPTKPKHLAEYYSNPASTTHEIINKIITVGKDEKTSLELLHKQGSEVVKLTGHISTEDEQQSLNISAKNSTQYFVTTFYNAMTENGIQVTGYPLEVDSEQNALIDDKRLMLLFKDSSEKLSTIVDRINKQSNNFFSEQLLKTIGYELYGYGSRENGIKGISNILEKMGINPESIALYDGSGLSYFNLVTPKQITKLLTYMYKSDAFESFYNSLALAGFSGTLADRMNKTNAENNFRGKTGSLENVKAIAGYIKTADGEPLVVSLIVNNFLVPSQLANYVHDKVCNRLANFKRK